MSDDTRKPNERSKTRFEPVKRSDVKPPSTRPSQPSVPPSVPAPPIASPPILRTLEVGAAPRYAGLRRDERGVVVGAQGVVAVYGGRRQAAFLAALSQIADLSGGVALATTAGGPTLVLLTPPPELAAPSQFYDGIQGALVAARLSVSRARLFVGDGHIFVAYADPASPHGCDIEGSPPAQGLALLRPGESPIMLVAQPTSLWDALLHVPLLPAPAPTPTTLSLLTDRRMAALIAGYVQRHGMAYGVRFFIWRQDDVAREVALFDIVTAAELRPPPRFVCDFLRRLPATTLLSDVLEPSDLEHEPARRVLVVWGQRTPLYLPHVQDLLPAHSLLILAGNPWGTTVIAAPAPRTTMQQFTEAVIQAPTSIRLSAPPTERLRLRLELRPSGPSRGPVHGLLLDAPTISRLQRMVCHLPGYLFAHARIALGDGVALVLADDDHELSGLPLGFPLARSEPPTLLLPRGMRVLPALPQDLLIPVLGLAPETLTVLTPTSRYDVPVAALQPLSRLLRLDTPAQTGRIAVRSMTLPPLDLSDLEDLPVRPTPEQPTPESPTPIPEKEQRSLLERLLRSKPEEGPKSGDFQGELRRRAAELEQRGELELAAAFYTYLKEDQRASDCYQRLADHSR